MQLQELFDYKNQLMEDILTTKPIIELLGDTVDVEHPETLAYTQVFPCEYVPETVQDGNTYICFDVDIQRSVNKTYLLPTLYIWVFSHRSRLRLPDGGGVRTDKICNEICKKIDGSLNYGLGQLELTTVKRFAPMSDYQGKVMMFTAIDFKKAFDPNKKIPSNRKSG